VGLLRKDPKALIAAALSMYWWYAAAASAPTNGPTQKIHCMPTPITYIYNLFLLITQKQERKQKKKTTKFVYIYTYVVIPDFAIVVDYSSSKAPSWVDTSSSDGDGGQVHHEHSEPNRKRSQNLRADKHENHILWPKKSNET
jgi:hypothetical protein